jgi:hypothetical protein
MKLRLHPRVPKEKRTRLTVTERQYRRAQEDFNKWCAAHSVRQPAKAEQIARHLELCLEKRGPASTVQCVSAISNMYRKQGYAFDSRATAIQGILKRARASRHKPANPAPAEKGITESGTTPPEQAPDERVDHYEVPTKAIF